MALAMEYTSGNAKIKIMDDFCSAPDQKERDARILKTSGRDCSGCHSGESGKNIYALMKQKEEAEEQLTATRRKS